MNKEKFSTKFVDCLKSFRVIFLLFFIIISLVAVNYTLNSTGVVVNGVTPGGIAEKAGMKFDSKANLRSLELVKSINGKTVSSQEDFYTALEGVHYNTSFKIVTSTNANGYSIIVPSKEANKTIYDQLGISIRDATSSNIKLGIELEGGSRLILKPTKNLTSDQFDLLVTTLQNRLDVYGASGTKVNKITDAFTGSQFVIVESTSSNKNEIFELIKRQGEFEAKLGNVSVFKGTNVLRVFTDPQHAQLQGCSNTDASKYQCTYGFQIGIDDNGSTKFFDAAKVLPIYSGQLSEKIHFILDGKEMTALSVASSFKYQKVATPQITVSGQPMNTQKDALDSAKQEMRFLQAILSTHSLPSELEVVQSYSISSSLGQQFLDNALLVAIVATTLVALVLALRYRVMGIFIGLAIALLAEIFIVLGVAAFMKITIDLAAIGGLIASIGTGIDNHILITDEHFRKKNVGVSSKKKVKNALSIIMISYFAAIAAMVPLYFAGLKMLQGFAFMIIIGVTVGVFVTRPAYAAMLRVIVTTRDDRNREDEAESKED